MDSRPGQMESLVIDRAFWHNRRVFLTGHTGFKGGWTALLLHSLGAKVIGFALPPEDEPNLFAVAGIGRTLDHHIGDLNDVAAVRSAIADAQPEVVIHMGAQALVRRSYADPVSTYATNVMGTVHVLEAVRHVSSVRATVVVTSDKCYDNRSSIWGYREIDALGGHDPYSSSKGCAELVTDSYRRSFFHTAGASAIASGRAGNVIGGGDWALDRLVPDAIRAFENQQALYVRNPAAIRPWQHVLDPVVAYLHLAEQLVRQGPAVAEAWNFGPAAQSEVPVSTIVTKLVALWDGNARWERDEGEHPHEAAYLRLDCSKARQRLGWQPLIELDQALTLTVDWYKAAAAKSDMRNLMLHQIETVLQHVPKIQAPPDAVLTP